MTANPTHEYSFAGFSWLHGGWLNTWYLHATPPNSQVPDCSYGPGVADGGGGIYAARSFHQNGVHLATGDGAVRFVESQINQEVWAAIGTRDGGEVIDNEW